MNVNGKRYRTIWIKEGDDTVVQVIDQRFLPYKFVVEDIQTPCKMAIAIKDMHMRGAGLIGAAGGYGMYLAALDAKQKLSQLGGARIDGYDSYLRNEGEKLKGTRPTAINLSWAVDRQLAEMSKADDIDEKILIAFDTAGRIADEDAESCRKIGEHGVKLIEKISDEKNGRPVNILTHCNAGWLAFVDYGTATAPIYAAHDKGIEVSVLVDETRPRNQGARLTAWELEQQGIQHKVIADNTGGHLMQHGMVDIVFVGSDRTTCTGYVANKIGTYLKALAAKDNGVPFYAALPSSTLDWTIRDGIKDIPIEERSPDEVTYIEGLDERTGEMVKVRLTPKESQAANYAFDVTPPELVTGLITERGICKANERSILKLFPEYKGKKAFKEKKR